ncbi:MAG: class I SAM-dependent methyltransferase [Salinivirgaceae bacterium]|nr:class I SAM-dependent methyltransferase [Salinivirgaceae bacterium]
MNTHFDDHAVTWDNDPKKIERATAFAIEINKFIKPNRKLDALEFGCGTGLLSFQLKDFFKTITLADNSEGMINALQEKIAKNNIQHFKPLYLDEASSKLPNKAFDVIYTLMTLHHIHDLDGIIKKLYDSLKNGAYLCIADLVKEDGTFHSKFPDFDGHKGFDKKELSKLLASMGFEMVHYSICYEIERAFDDGVIKYPLFLMIAKKIK